MKTPGMAATPAAAILEASVTALEWWESKNLSIDDFLESVLETGLAVLCHLADFCLNAVFDNLFYGFPKNIGIPDSARCVLSCFDIGDQIFCLFFASYDRCDLRFDIGTYQMDRR